jgi:dihydroorotase
VGIWILNGLVADGTGKPDKRHVFVDKGKIAAIVAPEAAPLSTDGHEVIDAAGKLVAPGFIDMHVHLREPGYEHKETIATGSLSAAAGGFTTIACMPNTKPPIDSPEVLDYVYAKAKEAGKARVLSYACITRGQAGEALTDFEALKAHGAIGFTDDGVGVQSARRMKEAMKRAAELGLPIVAHCEDDTLIEGACVTKGAFAEKHGLKGIPNEAEAIHVGRDILLAEATGVHYHVCHVSTEQSVRLIRLGKACGVRVTAEVCPHHLLLSDEDIPGPDANWKMNPPLRSRRDVEAVIEGLEDGTIDMIVTDHAPHSAEEKARGMQAAPFGIVGFETAFPLLYTKFVKTGRWTLEFLIDKMTRKPADVFGLPWGRLSAGSDADLVIIDLEKERLVDPSRFYGKSRNTPFAGWRLAGWPELTMVAGSIVWREN